MAKAVLALPVLGIILLSGCGSGARPLAEFRGKSEPPGPALVLRLGPEAEGSSKLRLSGGPLQSAVILGEARREGGGWRISLTRLDWFSNWANGWTQASFLLEGTATLQGGAAGWELRTGSPPQLDTVESASIRYYDSYIREARGLAEFSHRWDRIQAVAADIRARLPAASLADRRALRRFLFPEVYGYDSPAAPGHARAFGLGVAWNSDYSREHFSEPLAALRDSGTLLRDYKESPGLLSLALAWKAFWERDGQAIGLTRDR